MSMTAYRYSSAFAARARTPARPPAQKRRGAARRAASRERAVTQTHARRAKGNPVPIPEPGSGTAYNSGPRKSVRRGNPK